jgi:hypothetical protein
MTSMTPKEVLNSCHGMKTFSCWGVISNVVCDSACVAEGDQLYIDERELSSVSNDAEATICSIDERKYLL